MPAGSFQFPHGHLRKFHSERPAVADQQSEWADSPPLVMHVLPNQVTSAQQVPRSIRCARNLTAHKMSRPTYVDLKATITRLDPTHLVDTGVLAIHLARSVVSTSANESTLGNANHDLATSLHGLAGVVVGVLLAANGQVVAGVRDN